MPTVILNLNVYIFDRSLWSLYMFFKQLVRENWYEGQLEEYDTTPEWLDKQSAKDCKVYH